MTKCVACKSEVPHRLGNLYCCSKMRERLHDIADEMATMSDEIEMLKTALERERARNVRQDWNLTATPTAPYIYTK